jgi:hypothetical protein
MQTKYVPKLRAPHERLSRHATVLDQSVHCEFYADQILLSLVRFELKS